MTDNIKMTTREISENAPSENETYQKLNERTAIAIGFRRDEIGRWHAPADYMVGHGPDIYSQAPDFCGEESSSLYLWLIEQHEPENIVLDTRLRPDDGRILLEGGNTLWSAAMVIDGEEIVGTGDTLGEALCYFVLMRGAHQGMFGGER